MLAEELQVHLDGISPTDPIQLGFRPGFGPKAASLLIHLKVSASLD